ncbi:hypothetical protein HOLleu_15414 [Holothuria leucospilota]|uniref:Uncharacterized protein n=1 Tax=Holothuria leucospilota TaxID=206669 RepID=A0A9Q1C7Y0_HOLLE|nr:hypothetical protein HOLleu_15414 [Holothuria leucospilota]
MEVSATFVAKTGIRAYTVKKNWNEDVLITCSSQVSVRATVSLLNKYGEIIKTGATSENGATVAMLRVNNPDERYRCVLNISKTVSSDSYSEFFVSSEVEITTLYSNIFCSSSIGNEGYVGESVTLTCKVGYYYDYCYFWEDTNKKVLETVITENFPEHSCTCPDYSHWQTCPLSISVSRSIYLNVSVIVNGTKSNTDFVMEFLCTSTPPRLIYWKVFGTYGNLLDFDNIDQQVNVNTTVNITQSPGETLLRISETVPGGNGIHTVMCSTYDTEKRVVAFLQLTTPSESSSDCASSDIKVTTFDNPTTTSTTTTATTTTIHESSTFVVSKTEIAASTEKGYKMKTDTRSYYLLIGFVSLPYVVIIFILVGIMCFMHHRHKKIMEVSVAVLTQNTLPEAVLHDNPAYLSFSEINGCSPDNENDEKTYANL